MAVPLGAFIRARIVFGALERRIPYARALRLSRRPRAQQRKRIPRHTMAPHLEVQMIGGGVAGLPDGADDRPRVYVLTALTKLLLLWAYTVRSPFGWSILITRPYED